MSLAAARIITKRSCVTLGYEVTSGVNGRKHLRSRETLKETKQMVTNINNTTDKQENTGRVKVSELPRDDEPVTELSSSEQRQIKGGTHHTHPTRPGSGGCDDEFGCAGNHNETLVRDAVR